MYGKVHVGSLYYNDSQNCSNIVQFYAIFKVQSILVHMTSTLNFTNLCLIIIENFEIQMLQV